MPVGRGTSLSFSTVEFIQKKRDGGEHSPEELRDFVDGVVADRIPDYQITAWLMAAYLNKLSRAETDALTSAMWQSGESLPREKDQAFWVDKHSTGGVGDKTSMILVPLVAAVSQRLWGDEAVKMPMISGRGLGFTGGTLDKLESIPGFRTRLSVSEAMALLQEQGFFMCGQTQTLAPADRKIYSLRDVTATVTSVPLIVASILSKKLSESLNGLVLDVKVGRGAFCQDRSQGTLLADELVRVGRAQGLAVTAVLTSMNEPLGFDVGHALEIEECADYLRGSRRHAGLDAVVRRLAVEMLVLAGRGKLSERDAEHEVDVELSQAKAFTTFKQMIASQGGQWAAFEQRSREGYVTLDCFSPVNGTLTEWRSDVLAHLLKDIGGARESQEQGIDTEAGIRLIKTGGQAVVKGELLCQVTVARGKVVERGKNELLEQVLKAVHIGSKRAEGSWILEVRR